jgi:hypothetical protein
LTEDLTTKVYIHENQLEDCLNFIAEFKTKTDFALKDKDKDKEAAMRELHRMQKLDHVRIKVQSLAS